MVKDGTNRGGRRVRAGAKPGPLGEKLALHNSGCSWGLNPPVSRSARVM